MTRDWLPRALEESRARGFLGPGPIEPQIEHALGFVRCWDGYDAAPPTAFLDLGSGGGLPGLVLLERWNVRGVLTDSMLKRVKLLREVLEWPDAPAHGEVISGRVEDVARWPEMVGVFDLVSARSFGPPAVTAECAAKFLRVGGILIVSEPPDDLDVNRWPEGGLATLGLRSLGRVRYGAAFHMVLKVSPTLDRYPRASGIPRKNPVF